MDILQRMQRESKVRKQAVRIVNTRQVGVFIAVDSNLGAVV